MPELAKIRKLAGWSRDRAAVEARTSYLVARLYELNRDNVKDPAALERLDRVYAHIRELADARRSAA